MSNSRPLEVLIVGGSGVFGSRLARLACGDSRVRLTLAGRRAEPLELIAAELGGCAIEVLDRDTVNGADLKRFDLVADCAGPFQDSDVRLIEQCMAAKVDYVDLADGREFVRSIGRFDQAARGAGVAIISGASSIPALSHAVLDRLTRGWRRIDSIRVGIFPGNRAPRGRSVVEAILSYVGKPVRVFAGGGWRSIPGWAIAGRFDCGAAGKRWGSVCDTPEQDLLVERYRPTVGAEFVAGLELPILHLGLWLLSMPVRWGLIRSLRPAAGALLWIAERLQPFGTDRGSMTVEAAGENAAGASVRKTWMLDANANRGPYVPVLAALALIKRRADGEKLPIGARPCTGILALEDFEPLLDSLDIRRTCSSTAERRMIHGKSASAAA